MNLQRPPDAPCACMLSKTGDSASYRVILMLKRSGRARNLHQYFTERLMTFIPCHLISSVADARVRDAYRRVRRAREHRTSVAGTETLVVSVMLVARSAMLLPHALEDAGHARPCSVRHPQTLVAFELSRPAEEVPQFVLRHPRGKAHARIKTSLRAPASDRQRVASHAPHRRGAPG